MQAWIIEQHGSLERLSDVLRLGTRPDPGVETGTARIRVEAVGLNHMDLWAVRGVRGVPFPVPMIPGCDIAGTIDWMGPLSDEAQQRCDALGLKEGADVVVYPVIHCGQCEACENGFPPLCPAFGLIGETTDGGCADWITVPVRNLVPRPAGVRAVDAASLPIAYITAWSMIHRKAQLREGQTILIHAGGSGVSVAAIQLAKLIGATVFTTVGSDEKAQLARQLGADEVIQYKQAPFRQALKPMLKSRGKRGVDVVIDHVGSDTFAQSIQSLAWGGKLVTCGATTGAEVTIDLKPVFYKNISILGSTMGSRDDLDQVLALVASGKLQPVIDSTYPMDALPQAIERLAARKAFGKIVMEVSND